MKKRARKKFAKKCRAYWDAGQTIYISRAKEFSKSEKKVLWAWLKWDLRRKELVKEMVANTSISEDTKKMAMRDMTILALDNAKEGLQEGIDEIIFQILTEAA